MSDTSKTRGISFEGDEHDVAAINQLAKENGKTAGKFVADAIKQVHGVDLEPLASFFRRRASQMSQSTSSEVGEAEHAPSV